MLIPEADNTAKVLAVLNSGEDLCIAVAFWGRGAQDVLPTRKKQRIRILLSLLAGGTDPGVVKRLLERAKANPKRFEVRHCTELHAKVFLAESCAVVSSSNMSTNGLGDGWSGIGGHIEVGYFTKNAADLEVAGDWFERLWVSRAKAIEPEDMALAQRNWELNKRARRARARALRKSKPAVYRPDQYWVAVYKTTVTEAERKRAKKAAEKKGIYRPSFDAYYNWDSIPDDATILDVDYESGRASCEGWYRTPREPEIIHLKDDDGKPLKAKVAQKIRGSVDPHVRRAIKRNIGEIWKRIQKTPGHHDNEAGEIRSAQLRDILPKLER